MTKQNNGGDLTKTLDWFLKLIEAVKEDKTE